jgi:hypothetical protein
MRLGAGISHALIPILGVPMLNTLSARLPRWRRKFTAVALTAGLATTSLALALPTQAQAEDANITCTPTQSVFAIKSTGDLMLYKFNDLSSTTGATASTPTKIGTSWNIFSKLIAGPDGWLYGIKPNNGGTLAYHWNGTTFDVQARSLGAVFNIYAVQARVNKITMDARGDFYTLQDDGTLRRWKYNTSTGVMTNQPVRGDWSAYNAIVATGDGVIYARKPSGASGSGTLDRYQIEPTSDRFLSARTIGQSNWNTFSSFFSVGGDILLGIRPNADLLHYRFRPDPDFDWAFQQNTLGGGWDAFIDVAGTSNSCKLTKSYVPVTPAVPAESNAPIAVLQAGSGQLEYALTDNIGRSRWGHQPDPTDFGGTAWTALSDANAYVGTPALTQGSDNKVDLTVHAGDSRSWGFVQSAPGAATLGSAVDRAGLMASGAAAAKSPLTNKLFLLAFDGTGSPWIKIEGVSGLLSWQHFTSAGSPVLTGTPTIGPGPNSTLTVIARDTAGTFWAASWNGSVLSAWSSLGGSGFTGKVSIVRYPGDLLRVFARDADGHIKTQKQTAAGTTFPGTWDQVGAADQTWPGSPSAVMAPDTGLVEVLVRGDDGKNYFAQELAQGAGSWPQFKLVQPEVVEQYTTDPTAFVYTAGGVPKWAFATYTQDFQVRVITAGSVSSSSFATTGTSMKSAPSDPSFTTNKLP